jgi:uncharacterized integral membrane protein
VYHLAAVYDLGADEESQTAVNIEGTRSMVEFAKAIDARHVHHVSSIAAAGLYEGVFREDMFDEAEGLDHPYFMTKHESEKIVRKECKRPWTIYRPSMVVGDSQTGEMDKIDGPYYFFKPIQRLRQLLPPWFPAVGFTLITIAAVANTALVNYVMGSRLLYGMARQGLLPAALGRVHGVRQTPYVAVGVLLAIVIGLQFAGDITQLAGATVLLLLFVFTVVNGALVVLKRREGDIAGCFNAPTIVPVLGAVVCLVMIVARVRQDDWRGPAIAGGLIAMILVLYALTRGRRQAGTGQSPPGSTLDSP